MARKYVMTVGHRNWNKFCYLLEEEITACKGGNDLSGAIRVLRVHFPNADVEESVEYFKANGGYCTCEILLNVDN